MKFSSEQRLSIVDEIIYRSTKQKNSRAKSTQVLTDLSEYFGYDIRQMSSTIKEEKFGRYRANNSLSKLLHDALLICTDSNYSIGNGVAQKYKLDLRAYAKLAKALGMKPQPQVKKSVFDEIATGDVAYVERGNRFFAKHQFMPKSIKLAIAAETGYTYDYDLECAAQSLLIQHARQLGLDKETPALDLYIRDRVSVRNRLARLVNEDKKTMKKVLHAMMFGSKLSSWWDSSIFALLGFDKNKVIALQQDPFIQQYKKDISVMWRAIKVGEGIQERLNGRAKALIYNKLESQVLKAAQKYLKKLGVRYLLEHDGFKVTCQLDIANLEYWVRRETGFTVKYEEEAIPIPEDL